MRGGTYRDFEAVASGVWPGLAPILLALVLGIGLSGIGAPADPASLDRTPLAEAPSTLPG